MATIPARVIVLAAAWALSAPSLPAQDAAERFRELRVTYESAARNTSLAGLRRLATTITALGEVDYAEDARTRRRAERLLEAVVDRPLGAQGYPLRRAAILALGRVVRSSEGLRFLLKKVAKPAAGPLIPDLVAEAIGRIEDGATVERLCDLGLTGKARVVEATLDGISRLRADGARRGARGRAEALVGALDDRSPRVVHAAARAVANVHVTDAVDELLRLIEADDSLIRLGVAWALGRFSGEPHVRDGLEELLGDRAARVREEAARSLLLSGDIEVCGLLVPRLKLEPKRVRMVIFDGLRRLSGLEIDDRVALWEAWWKGFGEKLVREQSQRRLVEGAGPGRPPRLKLGAKGRYDVTYYGIPVRSDRVLFILDISMSMRFGGVGDDAARLDVAKEELKSVLRRMTPDTRFNVLVFSTGNAYFSRRGLLTASLRNKRRAERWVEQLTAAGGTNSFGALRAVFEKFSGVDTVYFLSDGRPSRGMVTDPEAIVKRIKEMNLRRRVIINTIALVKWHPMMTSLETRGDSDDMARFMKDLADATGGTFVRRDE